jgi:hypothetical protein
MTTVIALVVYEGFVDISHPIFACYWHEIIWYLVLLDLYTLAGKDEYSFDKAVGISSSWGVGADGTARG